MALIVREIDIRLLLERRLRQIVDDPLRNDVPGGSEHIDEQIIVAEEFAPLDRPESVTLLSQASNRISASHTELDSEVQNTMPLRRAPQYSWRDVALAAGMEVACTGSGPVVRHYLQMHAPQMSTFALAANRVVLASVAHCAVLWVLHWRTQRHLAPREPAIAHRGGVAGTDVLEREQEYERLLVPDDEPETSQVPALSPRRPSPVPALWPLWLYG